MIQEKLLIPYVLVYSRASWPLAGIFWTAAVCLVAGSWPWVETLPRLVLALWLSSATCHMCFWYQFSHRWNQKQLKAGGVYLGCGFRSCSLLWRGRPGSVEMRGSRCELHANIFTDQEVRGGGQLSAFSSFLQLWTQAMR